MPLRNDLLNPISPDRPAGENLWYSPAYDKIKEARREEDEGPQGEWRHERKVADWPLTIKLIGEALATKTKDLQLAAWLAEAMLRRESVAGLRETLDLIRGLIENFWDGLFPEIEDGDADFRASPLRWLGERNDKLAAAVKSAPLTKGGFGWIQFRESRAVGSEAAADTYDKQRARQEALDEGKISEEVFDKDFDTTPSSSTSTWIRPSTAPSNRSSASRRFATRNSVMPAPRTGLCKRCSKRFARRCASSWPGSVRRSRMPRPR